MIWFHDKLPLNLAPLFWLQKKGRLIKTMSNLQGQQQACMFLRTPHCPWPFSLSLSLSVLFCSPSKRGNRHRWWCCHSHQFTFCLTFIKPPSVHHGPATQCQAAVPALQKVVVPHTGSGGGWRARAHPSPQATAWLWPLKGWGPPRAKLWRQDSVLPEQGSLDRRGRPGQEAEGPQVPEQARDQAGEPCSLAYVT